MSVELMTIHLTRHVNIGDWVELHDNTGSASLLDTAPVVYKVVGLHTMPSGGLGLSLEGVTLDTMGLAPGYAACCGRHPLFWARRFKNYRNE